MDYNESAEWLPDDILDTVESSTQQTHDRWKSENDKSLFVYTHEVQLIF